MKILTENFAENLHNKQVLKIFLIRIQKTAISAAVKKLIENISLNKNWFSNNSLLSGMRIFVWNILKSFKPQQWTRVKLNILTPLKAFIYMFLVRFYSRTNKMNKKPSCMHNMILILVLFQICSNESRNVFVCTWIGKLEKNEENSLVENLFHAKIS